MSGKIAQRNIETPGHDKLNNGLKCIQDTINFSQQLDGAQKCPCQICRSKNLRKNHRSVILSLNTQLKPGKIFKKMLNALCVKDVPGPKIFVPDVCFIEGQELSVFFCDPKQNRLTKMSGTIASKSLYQTLVRLKKQYKSMLEQNFQKNMLDKIDPRFMHQKYMEQLLPSHFHDGFDSNKLHENKKTFKGYILHKNPHYIIPAIEQHKINENEPFCVVYFNDGNSQLLSQRQFQTLVLMKTPSDIAYVQSFIKPKQQAESVFTSEYTQFDKQIDQKAFELAQIQMIVLIGGMDRYSDKYRDLEELEDNAIQLMKMYPKQYIKYCTYRMVHYLAMVSRVYIKHIKINWTMNDIGQLYIQKIFQFDTTDISERSIKFRLPPKGQNLQFYKDSQHFLTIYHQMKIHVQNKKTRIRSDLKMQTQKIAHEDTNRLTTNRSTIDRTTANRSVRNKQLLNPLNRLSRTFQISEQRLKTKSVNKNKQQKKIKLNLDHRYVDKEKSAKVSFFQSQRRKRIDSLLDKYNF